LIYRGGRNPSNGHKHVPPEKNGKQNTPKDFIVEPITLQKGLVGAKPEKVCRWILDLLNAQMGDTLDDLFPGTGIMGRVALSLGSAR
jgi:DNA modification methylase